MIYLFEGYELDVDLHELRADGAVCTVEPQVFDLLLYLVENRDRMVTKDELHEAIWAGRIVSEANLSNRIGLARQAVGDDGKVQAIIRTLPRRGFRFVADLSEDIPAGATTEPSSASTMPLTTQLRNGSWSNRAAESTTRV